MEGREWVGIRMRESKKGVLGLRRREPRLEERGGFHSSPPRFKKKKQRFSPPAKPTTTAAPFPPTPMPAWTL
jgi:hypothetical protein